MMLITANIIPVFFISESLIEGLFLVHQQLFIGGYKHAGALGIIGATKRRFVFQVNVKSFKSGNRLFNFNRNLSLICCI
jgi:hypothetical protein